MQGMMPIFVFGVGVMGVRMGGVKAIKAACVFMSLNNEIIIGIIETIIAIMNAKMTIMNAIIAIMNVMITIMVSLFQILKSLRQQLKPLCL
jgi:hypothetical protein